MLNNSFFNIIKRPSDIQTGTDNNIGYRVSLNARHIIYQAHFPEEPVTPGVCLLQMAIELLSDFIGCDLELVEMKNVKFLTILSPIENKEVEYTFNRILNEGERWKAQLTVSNSCTVFAKLSITCAVK